MCQGIVDIFLGLGAVISWSGPAREPSSGGACHRGSARLFRPRAGSPWCACRTARSRRARGSRLAQRHLARVMDPVTAAPVALDVDGCIERAWPWSRPRRRLPGCAARGPRSGQRFRSTLPDFGSARRWPVSALHSLHFLVRGLGGVLASTTRAPDARGAPTQR
jgi:hypothetical protein